MKQYHFLPLITLLCAAAAFFLRLQFCRTGFEAATGLPVAGNPYARFFLLLLAVLVVLVPLLTRFVPREKDASSLSFSAAFSTEKPFLLAVVTAGILLLGLSGVLEIVGAFHPDVPHWGLFTGLLTLIATGGLLPLLPLCRSHPGKESGGDDSFDASHVLLLPVCCLVIRLVLTYRADSVNPAIAAYFVEILALMFLVLSFYRLASFAYQVGRTRRLLLYALPAVILSAAALADGHPLGETLFYAGAALTVLGFVLLRLDRLAQEG